MNFNYLYVHEHGVNGITIISSDNMNYVIMYSVFTDAHAYFVVYINMYKMYE